MSKEIQVEELAEFIFLRNKNNAIVEMSLGGIEDTKDLFFFCLDMFCKGLVMLYGENNRLIINDINEEQFNVIQQKLKAAGIQTCLYTDTSQDDVDTPQLDKKFTADAPPDVSRYPYVNIEEINAMPSNLDIEQYIFKIKLKPDLTYCVQFRLFHKVT